MIINKLLRRKPHFRTIGNDTFIYVDIDTTTGELVINSGEHQVRLTKRDVLRINEQAAIAGFDK